MVRSRSKQPQTTDKVENPRSQANLTWLRINLHCLALQRLDFTPKCFVLRQLSPQKSRGGRSLFRNPLGRQDVGIAPLVFGGTEVVYLDEAAGQKRAQQVVRAAIADANGGRQLPLRHSRIVMQKSQHPELGVFLDFAALAGQFDCSGFRTGLPTVAPLGVSNKNLCVTIIVHI